MRFVLTGNRGLIGSSLLRHLKHDNHEPAMLVDSRNETDDDLCEYSCLTSLNYAPKKDADIIFHLAADCRVRDSFLHPCRTFKDNIEGTFELVRFCYRSQIPKIVFTSSTRVLYPEKNLYTCSKLFGEELIKSYAQSYGIEYVIVRPSTVYGPFNDRTQRLVHKFMVAAISGKPLKIYGDKNKTLDFTYVDDFIEALIKASTYTNKTFNIGSGQETKLVDVAEYIIKLAGKGSIEFHPPEKQQPQNVVIDTDFPCPTPWEKGIKKTFDWYKKHKNKIYGFKPFHVRQLKHWDSRFKNV